MADRTQQRGVMVILLSCIGGIGYILLATVETVGVRYLGVWLAAAGVFPAIANILPWVMSKSEPLWPPGYLSNIAYRQPRIRHSSRSWNRFIECYRPMRTPAGN